MNSADPKFLQDLKDKQRRNESPVPAVPRTLLRKRAPNYNRLAFKKSVILHGSVVVLGLASSLISYFTGPSKAEEAARLLKMSKTAIRVDIVDLPSMKMDEMRDLDLSKEVGKSEKAEEPKAAEPSKTAMKDSTAPATPSPSDRLKKLREKLRSDSRRKELMDKLKGKESGGEGRPVLAGNKLSEGASITGEVATEADAYNSRLQSHLSRFWTAPDWMTTAKLSARVLVRIRADGSIIDKKFLVKSSSADFNENVERALRDAEPFPPPPKLLLKIYSEDGIEWGFPK